MRQEKQKQKKKDSAPLKILLATLLSSCGHWPEDLPKPPSQPIYQIDLPRGVARGAIIGTGAPVDPVPVLEMDKWSCLSPESKAVYDDYVQSLIDAYNRKIKK